MNAALSWSSIYVMLFWLWPVTMDVHPEYIINVIGTHMVLIPLLAFFRLAIFFVDRSFDK